MSAPTNHWKLGLFVVGAVLFGIGFFIYLGTRAIPKETVTYNAYFDESVTGLDMGSPVKFRGVTIGNVSSIELAPDRRHVKVAFEFTVATLDQLGIARDAGEKTRLPIPPNLRAQLTSTGVTGIKYIQLDFFDQASLQTPELPFPVGDRNIPAQASSMKNIEASVVQTADRLPEVTEHVVNLLTRAERIAEQVETQRLPERLNFLLTHFDHTLTTLDEKLGQLDTKGLSQDSRAVLSSFHGTAQRANRLLDRMDGDRGLLASAERFSSSLGDAASNANGFTTEMEHTLRDVSEAAAAVRDLADALERQPDMLIKGRSSRAER
jgi:phospholipid/cholesterol/gamma-HCH transport system substrate-binding protein